MVRCRRSLGALCSKAGEVLESLTWLLVACVLLVIMPDVFDGTEI